MVNLLGRDGFDVEVVSGSSIKITERHGDTDTSRNRVLHMVCGNMFHLRNIEQADIIMLETEVPQVLSYIFCINFCQGFIW